MGFPDHVDDARLRVLQEMLCARIEDLLAALDVSVSRAGKIYQGCCPVHGGDNPNALSLYWQGDTVPGYWRCWTRGCERTFKRTVLGFVRGVLSRQKYAWTADARPAVCSRQRTVSFPETLAWCCRFLGRNLADIKADDQGAEKLRFSGAVARMAALQEARRGTISKAEVRRFLRIPADYFVRRGWSPEVLDRFDVGLYPGKGRPMSDRVAVPIYDEEGHGILGFTARSIFEQCSGCNRWHSPATGCPEKSDQPAMIRTAKWYNHNFDREGVLYNLSNAARPIAKTGVACLVEGPGDLWRLEEAGISCGVALLGSALSEGQQILVETSGATKVLALLNMDVPGRMATLSVKKQLERVCKVIIPDLPAKDLGEMTPSAVGELLLPLIEKHCKRY